MSSRYVRQQFETWLNNAGFVTPFYSSINQEVNPKDAIWVTADYAPGYREVLTFCDGVVSEDGEVELIFMGQPGQGYDAVIQALERDVNWLMQQKDPGGKLVLTNRSSPYEYTAGDAGLQYSMSVYVEYSYYE